MNPKQGLESSFLFQRPHKTGYSALILQSPRTKACHASEINIEARHHLSHFEAMQYCSHECTGGATAGSGAHCCNQTDGEHGEVQFTIDGNGGYTRDTALLRGSADGAIGAVLDLLADKSCAG